MPQPVVIVPYDMNWPWIYEEEKRLVLGGVRQIVRSLEHIGSTSVPGLCAKPIVDILAGVDGPGEASIVGSCCSLSATGAYRLETTPTGTIV